MRPAPRASGTKGAVVWLILLLTLLGAVGSCWGAREGVQAVLPTSEVAVYEECIDTLNGRRTECRPLDEPRTETRVSGGVDVWAAMAAFAIAAMMGVYALVWVVTRLYPDKNA